MPVFISIAIQLQFLLNLNWKLYNETEIVQSTRTSWVQERAGPKNVDLRFGIGISRRLVVDQRLPLFLRMVRKLPTTICLCSLGILLIMDRRTIDPHVIVKNRDPAKNFKLIHKSFCFIFKFKTSAEIMFFKNKSVYL